MKMPEMMKTPEEIKRGLACSCVCSEIDLGCKTCPYLGDNCPDVHSDALAYIQQLEQRVPRWISVEERLPEHWHMDDKDRTLINYLVYSPDYGVDVGNYIKSAKRWVCMGLPMNVTHWMPLPEPPEEGES